jgi:beta-lactamase superfamily II metal-dependent hydrolase
VTTDVTDVQADMPHGVILDVGHGNAAVFFDGLQAIVIDAGSTDLVADTLERHGVSEIAALVVSHRHHDHTSELPSLLANPDLRVRKLFANADPTRAADSRFEKQLRGAFNDSRRRNGTEFHQANETIGHYMNTERLQVQVFSPDSDFTWRGVGSATSSGARLHPHALAVVLRVSLEAGRSVLFGSDLDGAGFQRLIDSEDVDLSADVLVYPHHGGRTDAGGANAEQAFAEALTQAVGPEAVVFSNGRERHFNPRREVVRGVRTAPAEHPVRILCTQLGTACSAVTFPTAGRLDASLGSHGAERDLSCSGSLRVALDRQEPLLPRGASHLSFVQNTVGEDALCVGQAIFAS